MKKGFTLIELLAVIVILAIIALIATPLIMGVIEDARKGSFKNSAYGMISAIEHEQIKNFMDGTMQSLTFTYENGEETSIVPNTTLNYKGTKPQSGAITINGDGKIALALYNGSYCVIKNFEDTDVNFSNQNEEDCTLDNLPALPIGYKDESGASSPLLSAGMIPVVYTGDTNNPEWSKADTVSEWYNYNDKRWANAVLVKTTGIHDRDSYVTGSAGMKIEESDILAHLVWVPRYRYQLFNVEATVSSPQLISIEFEDKDAAGYVKENGSANGTWLTHPAFTFGSESDSELEGIWVGKFETTGNSTTPTVLPYTSTNTGITSLRSLNVSTHFATSQIFSNTTDYGLVTNNDSRMMKNIEWGAVAYLAASIYGQALSEVWVNNSGTFHTGCAGNSVSESSISGCQNEYYTTNGVNASTTGNVYGIYDMSGGAWEYMMGHNSGSLGSSGFSLLPDSKYYDSYITGTTTADQAAYNRLKLGDATGETRGWHGDFANFIYFNGPWFVRGGLHGHSALAGVLAFYSANGNAYLGNSFRLVVLG